MSGLTTEGEMKSIRRAPATPPPRSCYPTLSVCLAPRSSQRGADGGQQYPVPFRLDRGGRGQQGQRDARRPLKDAGLVGPAVFPLTRLPVGEKASDATARPAQFQRVPEPEARRLAQRGRAGGLVEAVEQGAESRRT